MNDNELKLIGKHKSQLETPKPVIEKPTLSLAPIYRPVPTPEPEVSVEEVIKQKSRVSPGVSEDLLRLTKDINKNIEYVLGADQKDESRNKETINEEETID